LQNEEVDLSEVDVYLEELEGDALGKSTEDKAVIIDSRIALHPGMRQALLVSVFVHEGLHEKGEIPENLVRASVEEILNDPSQAKGGYKDGIKAAKKVAEAIGHGDLREGLMKLRDYYKKGEFNQLYIDFLNTFAGEEGVPVQAEDEELEVRRDEAYEIFKTAFPELSIVEAA